jgi:hypothetical protein
MKNLRRVVSLFCLGAFGVAGGCDSEAGSEYTGEVLLKLDGTVTATSAIDSSLVPALLFVTPTGSTSYVVDGKMTGEFPSRFTFKVASPPPESAFFAPSGSDLHGQVAMADFALLPSNHPKTLDALNYTNNVSTCTTAEFGQPCTVDNTFCNSKNACFVQHLGCVHTQCPIAFSSGDATLSESDLSVNANAYSSIDSTGSIATVYRGVFDHADINHNHQEIRVCQWSGIYDTVWTEGYVDQCTLNSETGDTSVDVLTSISLMGRGLSIVYMSEANPSSSIGPLKKGYNVLRSGPQTEDELVAFTKCQADANYLAVLEYNQTNGTTYLPMGVNSDTVPGYAQIQARIKELQSACPPRYAVVADGEDVNIIVGAYLSK